MYSLWKNETKYNPDYKTDIPLSMKSLSLPFGEPKKETKKVGDTYRMHPSTQDRPLNDKSFEAFLLERQK
jgi:hypothetical protein